MKTRVIIEVPEHLRHLKKVVRPTRGNTIRRARNRFTLKREPLEWLKSNCKHHWVIVERTPGSYSTPVDVLFYSNEEAMLFKLTWL